MIKRAKVLKETKQIWIKKIAIVPDLTMKEREENMKQREELQMKKQQGGKWIIKIGKNSATGQWQGRKPILTE